ncbi:hypothetical protein HYFRA_00008435 [Hymenoscyphus fraxineus]|uniref:Protein EFR3 n=1 Tax=Hymenoscyphus fraxineus TaxID=746836 RepID=A0A9N9PP16_9HELO|nr:hypothetical protein HYFRA_00008435 [Hymenoscyphus fraxineus]
MISLREKCRPKHQVLILKCYPRTTKGAVDVKPNSSELSYLLYYATTRRSKVQKVGAFLEKKTASDVWRARIGNVQVTLQILEGMIEKAPRDLPLYADYVLKILVIILRSRDITMVESSLPTFKAFCDHHDGASLSADQEYLRQYEEIVKLYSSFASPNPPPTKPPISEPVAIRWRNVGLQAISSIASSEALASTAGKQLNVIIPMVLENLWTDNEEFVGMLETRVQEVQTDAEKTMLKRKVSNATVQTVDTAGDHNAAALSATTADADKLAEENIGVLAMQCLQQIYTVPNRSQIHQATEATLAFVAEHVSQCASGGNSDGNRYCGWATRIFEMVAQWTPVQDRYVILVTAVEVLVQSPVVEENLQEQLTLATMVDSLLKSETINLIGLSVMDVLLGLIKHVVKLLQMNGNPAESGKTEKEVSPELDTSQPSPLRKALLERVQDCVSHLATHVYYGDQISDMVSALLLRLKPSPSSNATTAASIENPNPATLNTVNELLDDNRTDGFFLFGTAKVKALEAVKAILLVASHRKNVVGGASLGRNPVPIKVWEGTQWLLRDSDIRVRKAYIDAFSTWLGTETNKGHLRVADDKPKLSPKLGSRNGQNNSSTKLSKRVVSNASQTERNTQPSKTTFLELLHLAIYENAIQFVDSESDFVLLHFLLANLVARLGVNAVKSGLPMIYRLQEDILEAETPLAKIRMGSLCHGYFWILSERFDFDTSPVGRTIHEEIHRRRSKMFWVDRVCMPPIAISKIGTPGTSTPEQPLPRERLETEALTPFDERFEMVKLISLSYAASLTASLQISPPSSPGRSFSGPVLNNRPSSAEDFQLPEKTRGQMMSEWNKDEIIALAQEGSKSVSISGSKTGTTATRHRKYLAVNGDMNTGGTNSRNQSPPGGTLTQQHRKPDSSYGLLGGLSGLHNLRKASVNSGSPASDSSRNSVTRVDHLKKILAGQADAPPRTRGGTYSDASSSSMVSYDFTASDVSYNGTGDQNQPMERSVSLREPNRKSRSKSRDRLATGDHQRPSTSQFAAARTDPNISLDGQDFESVPPVPPLPNAHTGDSISVHDHALTNSPAAKQHNKVGTRSRKTSYGSGIWGEEPPTVDLESLLRAIDTTAGQKGNVSVNPPY